MKEYASDRIRNVALVGHGGSGKTTLVEAALYSTGVISRMGKVEDGNTVADYDKMEIDKGMSIGTSVVPVEWDNVKINFLDTPGYFDFVGEVISSLRVARAAVIVVDASSGVQVGTEKVWKYARERNLPTFIIVNKMDKENVNFENVVNQLRDKLGKSVAPFMFPMGGEKFTGFVNVVDMKGRTFTDKGFNEAEMPADMADSIEPLREMLIESVAESDEELLEKYFEGEEFTQDEIHAGLKNGIADGSVVPILVSSAVNNNGIPTLLDILTEYVPNPKEHGDYVGKNPKNDEEETRKCSESEPLSALVFKTIVDPFVGKISLLKIISGILKTGTEVFNSTQDKSEKIGNMFMLRGKNQVDVSSAAAGDIIAISKLQNTATGDTLCDKAKPIIYNKINFPEPTLFMALEPKDKGDEEKIGTGLNRLTEEDPSFVVQRNTETRQTLVGGQGDIHISVITAKLKDKFGVNVNILDQKIPYRETVKGKADVQGKHKKQSGGAGQYGDVHIRFSQGTEDFEFSEEIFGGSVPKQYIPAVEKGLRECLDKGVLAGYPVVNLKAVLYDGSYHDVDSSEMAFKIAASLAFKKGMQEAKPVMLEPVMHVEINIPDDYMGDIMGDMNKRRGRILGMEPQSDGSQKVVAEAPMAEMFKYAIDLRSMTQARGSFTMKFDRYEEVPAHLADKIIADAKKDEE
ncbi:MAG: elongation factor G [Clostridia bacterium]|nr:elongation factor G [Clostridia bacterium]